MAVYSWYLNNVGFYYVSKSFYTNTDSNTSCNVHNYLRTSK